MNIAAALGLDNDPALKTIRDLQKNFTTLFELKSTSNKEKESYRTRRDVFLRREAKEYRQVIKKVPAFNDPDGFAKGVDKDKSGALLLLLGGGLLAATMLGGARLKKNLGGFIKDIRKSLFKMFNIPVSDVKPTDTSEIEDVAELPNVGTETNEETSAPSAAPPTSGADSLSPAEGQGEVATSGSGLAYDHYKYLTGSLGLSDYHARGLVANAMRESSLRPAAVGDGGDSYGLLQWNRVGGRRAGMVRAVPDWKTNWKAQYKYALTEDVGPKYAPKKFSSAQAAADWWMKYWERPAHPARDSRKHTEILASFKFQQGGPVSSAVAATALPIIRHHEALSSLTKGQNDFIKGPGPSVKSKTPWEEIKPSTPIHAYPDKGGIPTIGWGSIYNDSMMGGKSKVKLGDVWPKKKADDKLKKDTLQLLRYLRRQFKFYQYMTLKQQAAFLSQHYNTGAYTATDSDYYPAFKKHFAAGNIGKAADNHPRKGGAAFASRIAEESAMMKQGPLAYDPNTGKPTDKSGGKGKPPGNLWRGGFVAPKRSTSKINTPPPKVTLQMGGMTPTDTMMSLHSPEYTGSMIKKKHMRPVVIVNATAGGGGGVNGNVGISRNPPAGNGNRNSYFSQQAKTMYRVQKGAFT